MYISIVPKINIVKEITPFARKKALFILFTSLLTANLCSNIIKIDEIKIAKKYNCPIFPTIPDSIKKIIVKKWSSLENINEFFIPFFTTIQYRECFLSNS